MAEWVRAPAYNLREQGVAGSILGQVKFLFLNQIFYLAPQCRDGTWLFLKSPKKFYFNLKTKRG